MVNGSIPVGHVTTSDPEESESDEENSNNEDD